jgi:hypothetical protein
MYKSLILSLALLFIISCKSDKSVPIDQGLILGGWIIESAQRDGNETSTLQNAFMEFTDKGFCHTNIFPKISSIPYVIDGNNLKLNGSIYQEFEIKILDSLNLTLEGKILKHKLTLKFTKDLLYLPEISY